MAESGFVRLTHRGVLTVGGEDRRSFLQGLISNDIGKADGGHALWAAFLTPQGKFTQDLFVVERGDAFLIDAEAARMAEFLKKLSLHRLRAKVALAAAPEYAVWAALGDGVSAALGLGSATGAAASFAGGVVFVDPRLAEAGARAILPAADGAQALAGAGLAEIPFALWDETRIRLGLPDGSRDLPVDKAILLENGFDELGGVDFKKGCYMGQELTSRTKHRGLVRKRLMPVAIEGAAPEPGVPVTLGETEVGEMRSASGPVGLALIRLDAFRQAEGGGTLACGGASLRPWRPDWAVFPTES